MSDTKSLVRQLIIELAAYFLIASVFVLIFTNDKFKGELGLFIGVILAILMVVHMNHSLNKLAYMERRQSVYSAFSSIGRLLCVGVCLFLAARFKFANVYTMLIGVFGLKPAAHLQPYLARFLNNRKEGR